MANRMRDSSHNRRARSAQTTRPVRAGTASTRSQACRSSPRVRRRTNRRSGTITKYVRPRAKTTSPIDRDERRENPQRRSVESHAADVNREQHGQERRDPAAIGRHPVLFGLLEPRAGFGEALGPFDADVGDHALVRVALGVDGGRCQIERRRGQPQTCGERHHPVRGVSADQQDRECDSQIPGRGACSLPKGLPPGYLTDNQTRVTQGVDGERHRHEDRERGHRQPGCVQQQQSEEQRVRTRSTRRSVARRTSCAGIPGQFPRRRRRGGTGPPRAPAPPPRAAPAMRRRPAGP